MWRSSRSSQEGFDKPDYEIRSRTNRPAVEKSKVVKTPTSGKSRDARFAESEIPDELEFDEDR
ncbi:hypothetical protein ACI2KR_07935 [Pseudomonas luteola]